MKVFRFIYFLLGAMLLFCAQIVFSQTPNSSSHEGGVPHQPNFLGKNICLGIQFHAADGSGNPIITTVTKFGGKEASHEIKFGPNKVIIVTEDLVDPKVCDGLPLNKAQWGNSQANFCMKSWQSDKYVKVLFKSSDSDRGLLSSLYAIGSCQTGDISPDKRQGYFYGELLKVSSMPVQFEN